MLALTGCIVAKDEPPMIVYEDPIQVRIGTDPIYFGDYVIVVDIEDGYIALNSDNIDVSNVNFSRVGLYEVVITVEDSAGNIVSEEIPFEIIEYTSTLN
jgi:hypothetical protein